VGAASLGACSDDQGADDGDDVGEGTGTSGSGGSEGSDSGGTQLDTDTGSEGESETGTETGDEPYELCEQSDLSPAELLAGIDHIVVVMMENRSFDHYFGALSLAEGLPVDGLSGAESNPNLEGQAIPVFNTQLWTHGEDPPHSWNASHAQFNAGVNDGFVREHQDHGAQAYEEAMGYYLRDQLPVYHGLIDAYQLCDRWFASVMTSTWPNRHYLHCATSNGAQGNTSIDGVTSIFDQLADAGISHRYYYANLPFVLTYGADGGSEHIQTIDNFFIDAEAGDLPSFCIVEPILSGGLTVGNDDHPPADVREGQAFIASIYEALAASPNWERCLLVVVYDEHGGFHDHVPPPLTADPNPGFEQLGFRVPAMVVGPQVRRGCVNGTVFDHVSIAATVAVRWGLDPLNDRVAATNDLSSCIDPAFIDNPNPPISIPRVLVPRKHEVYVPGGNVPGQTELLALYAKGDRGAGARAVRASQESAEFLRDFMFRRDIVRTR